MGLGGAPTGRPTSPFCPPRPPPSPRAQGLSCTLWGFARLGFQPPPRWMDAFLSACLRNLGAFKPQEVGPPGGLGVQG
jgi:hypothetical protein